VKIRTLAFGVATLLALTSCASGSSPEATSSNPSATPRATDASQSFAPPAGGDFCEIYDAARVFGSASSEAQAAYDAAVSASPDPTTDPAVLEALHAMGAASKSDSEDTVAFLLAASDATDDQALKDAIATVVSLTERFSIPIAEAAIVATDNTTYDDLVYASFAEGEFEGLLDDAINAAAVIDDYATESCNAWSS
jgi:hypothetical protein